MTPPVTDGHAHGIDGITPELSAAIGRIARVPLLLVACDYDGTLAPIVEDPTKAVPLPESVAAIRALAALPQTTVAVVSGRALRDLAALSRLPSEVHLVGSHGSEFDIGFVERLAPELVAVRSRLKAELRQITHGHAGVRLEIKPASVAVHTRGADPGVTAEVVEAVRSGPATWPEVTVTHGKEVVELSVVPTHKGTAVDQIRTQMSASAVLFIGDDITDENAFAHLHGPDMGIKIGPGETRAEYRVGEPIDAARVLGLLLETRRHWLFGERAVPIERHSMLANGRTVALLTPEAKVTWLSHPKPDSPAVFADLLGGGPAGHFTVTPDRGGLPLGQRYRPGTMTVETRWSGLTVTDWLDHRPADIAGGDTGDTGDSTLVRVLSGTGRARIEFAPRPEFGQVSVQLQPLGDGLLVLGSNEPFALYSPGVEWEIVQDGGHENARAVVDLPAAGGSVTLELRFGSHSLEHHTTPLQERQGIAETPWRSWLSGLRLPSTARELVARSALTLRGLCHEATGSILAAATTSLPEEIGGVRNWDYRYCWLRDAAMTARALVDLGSLTEAEAFLRWVDGCVERTGGHPERLHPLYTVEGYELGAEAVIDTLPGYAGSRPVRVGNLANHQLQLDVFGPIADLLAAVADARGSVREQEWRVLESMVQAVERRWHEPDHGLWEARLAPRHHVYSKVMCWMTVDRALHVVRRHGGQDRPEWVALRDRIGHNVLEHGWHPGAGAYTVAYGDEEMDASSLWIGLSGLLPDDDPRFLATVLKVEADLRSGPVVYRYRWDDGLPGREGGFHICTAWLIEAYLRTGRRGDAEELFMQMVDTAGPTGLLPEQYDPLGERGLGNHPQAYSHLGLIRCALLLDDMLKD
ncbi:trehalose 6-phosphatase [Micromonospora pattaloongensis]|uniref:Trehalose 6-phosphatase n=1 Tax=Micromonospora pattaloongensis TaxID=405436 RepID=A0A1H3STH8_9ACTN|nr:trehalose-phosphatase [Micromonospora pattaloongensis]SDZ41403.1 trehalose 6-phosphatase [Micromonospora pattaloongensis]